MLTVNCRMASQSVTLGAAPIIDNVTGVCFANNRCTKHLKFFQETVSCQLVFLLDLLIMYFSRNKTFN